MIVCLDTNVVIYLVESKPIWTAKATARVAALRTAGEELAVCDPAILECLVHPIRAGDAAVEAAYRTLFASTRVRLLPAGRASWEHAARIGAAFNFKALDSLHLAIAVEQGCGLFLTADANLARCTSIPVEVLA